jgi:hypothetical protein
MAEPCDSSQTLTPTHVLANISAAKTAEISPPAPTSGLNIIGRDAALVPPAGIAHGDGFP